MDSPESDTSKASGGQVLAQDVLRQIEQVRHAEILVGIPAFNSEATIGHVVTAVETGLRKNFPDRRSVICVSDGGSADRTLEVARQAGVGDDYERLLVPKDSPVPERVCFCYRGLPGKGSAFRSIFEVARRLEVKACAVVDSDLRSITPYWLDRLISPIVNYGYEFVAPVYSRHKFDGTITNSIAFPLTTALYGARIRQPIGGEFGFSGELAGVYASKRVWKSDVARFGIDIWMTTVAVVEGFRVCQGVLGAKLHDPKDPGKDLAPMFRQVVGSLFALAGRYRSRWWDVEEPIAPPIFGFRAVFSAEPIQVSVPRLVWRFVEGYIRHHELWASVLSEESMRGVTHAVEEAAEKARDLVVDAGLWTRIVYDFLIAYNLRVVDPGELLDSLIPLYFARTASFVHEVQDASEDEAEERIQELADVAVSLKPYLRRRWQEERVPDRRLREQPVPDQGAATGLEDAVASGA